MGRRYQANREEERDGPAEVSSDGPWAKPCEKNSQEVKKKKGEDGGLDRIRCRFRSMSEFIRG